MCFDFFCKKQLYYWSEDNKNLTQVAPITNTQVKKNENLKKGGSSIFGNSQILRFFTLPVISLFMKWF